MIAGNVILAGGARMHGKITAPTLTLFNAFVDGDIDISGNLIQNNSVITGSTQTVGGTTTLNNQDVGVIDATIPFPTALKANVNTVFTDEFTMSGALALTIDTAGAIPMYGETREILGDGNDITITGDTLQTTIPTTLSVIVQLVNMWNGINMIVKDLNIGGVAEFDVDAQALFDRYDTAGQSANAQTKTALNNFFVGMKADGNYSKYHVIWLPALHHEDITYFNILADANNGGTIQGAASTFTAFFGHAPNGTDNFVDLNFTPNGVVALDSCGLSVQINSVSTDGGVPRVVVGANRNSTAPTSTISLTDSWGATDEIKGRMNDFTDLDTSETNIAAGSVYTIQRTGSAAKEILKSGISQGTSTTASTSIPNIDLYLFANHKESDGLSSAWSDSKVDFVGVHDATVNDAQVQSRLTNLMVALRV